jgi:hypothetical protein
MLLDSCSVHEEEKKKKKKNPTQISDTKKKEGVE